MPNKHSAVELIKKFQQLFTDLNHKQIAERLLKLVIAKSLISRAALLVRRDGNVYVEAIALQGDKPTVVSVTSAIDKLKNLPSQTILESFDQNEESISGPIPARYFCSDDEESFQGCLPGSNSLALYPIFEKGHVIGLFVLETEEHLPALQQAVSSLEHVWTFSSLLVRQIIDMWRHEEQAEKYRMAEQALWASETYLNAIMAHSPALISVKDLNGNIVMASEHFKQLDGLADAELAGKNVFDVYPQSVVEKFWSVEQTAVNAEETVEAEMEIPHVDGELHTYLVLRFPLRDKNAKVFGLCTISTDITERKQAEDALHEQQARLNYLAFHDSLTGLPNRSLFYDRIYHSLARSRRGKSQLALMLLDLDRFKNINDSLGHDAGDLLLKAISQRLTESVRDMDTVARLGGDEFVVVLEGIHDHDDISFVANKLLENLSKPIHISGHEISTTVSIGISVFPDDGEQTDTLLKHADIAMYKAKEGGKNNYQYYTEGMNATAVNFLLLENDLRRAIEQEQLTLHYQPQIDFATGSLIGLEALVRWNHPDRGLVSPVNFIPLAEETGLIVPLGEWVLRSACLQQMAWIESGIFVGKVAVNLSPRQFRQKNFPQKVASILAETGLPAKYLELEITESSAMEHAGETINQLNELNRMGLSLAIDDFGTGYSSLAYLKRFPIHKLKIDRSFISEVHVDQNDAAIAKSIIGMAHNMMLNVVAEGVESEEQAHWLRERGCDYGQGFLFAKPIPAENVVSFFHKGHFSFDNNVVKLEVPA